MKTTSCFVVAAVMSLFVGFANTSLAGNVAVTNADFETGGSGTTFISGDPAGWTSVNNGGAGVSYATGIADVGLKNLAVDLNSVMGLLQIQNSTGSAEIYFEQSLGIADTSKTYTASVEVGFRDCCGGLLKPDDYRIELLDGASVFATASLLNGNSAIPSNDTVLLTAIGTPAGGGALSIRLYHSVDGVNDADVANRQSWFDNVDVDAVGPVTPEPMSFLLATLGLVCLTLRPRHRRR